MDAPTANEPDRLAVAAARLTFFEGQSECNRTQHVESLEGRFATLIEMTTVLQNEVHGLRNRIELIQTALQNEVDALRTQVEDTVQTAVHVEMNLLRTSLPQLLKGAAPQPEVDLFDDEHDDNAQNSANAPDIPKDDDGRLKCAVCNSVCQKIVRVAVPCGHYPYCSGCIEELTRQRDNIQEYLRDEDWESAVCYCPECMKPCTSTHTLRLLDPYKDSVARIN